MKTIVITFSKHFPKHHPKAGNDIHFVESILNGQKKTTIRSNYKRWEKIADQLEEGTHILSLRYWTDKPYRSKQIAFARCAKINIETVFITNNTNGFEMTLKDEYLYYSEQLAVAKKEGFNNLEDFRNWFQEDEFSGIMIEFLEIDEV
jgi:hypothetical protein